jgi:Baseplate J-like protein
MAPSSSLSPLQLVIPVLPTGTSVVSIDSSVLPLVVNADTSTTRIEVGIYNTSYAINTFSVVGIFNQFDQSIPLTPSVSVTNVTIIGRNYDPTVTWVPGTNYPLNSRFADPNENVEVVVQSTGSGTSSSTGLAITATSVVSNVLTVTCNNSFSIGQPVVLTGTAEAVLNGQTVIVGALIGSGPTFTGFTATFVASNFSNISDGGSVVPQPKWSKLSPTTGTQVAVSANVLTVNCVNSFSVGQSVYLTGFVNATLLNGQVVTISSASPTAFSAPLSQGDYPAAADSGTVQAATLDNQLVWANIGPTAITPTVRFSLLFAQSDLSIAIAPPSGISSLKDQTDCTLQWVTPDYPGFIGVRVQISTDPAGISPPFTQYGDLVTAITSSANTVITSSSNTSVNVPTATISNVVLANNLVTIVAQNSFVPGMVVEIAALANATFLNGESLTILSATPTGFTSLFTYSNPVNGTNSYGNVITATSISGNVLSVTAQNSYSVGQQVVISGTAEPFLNGQVLTVTSVTPFTFTATFTHSNYANSSEPLGAAASIADDGTAISVISTSTTSTLNTSMLTNYSTVNVPFSTINATTFYAMFSTVVQDPTTNILYESVENGPLLCGYVNLQVANPTDFPVLQRKEDIAGRLIAQINKQLPDLDLSPRSEVRDIFIDPFSIELANMSVREWFARVSTSISAISQIDNASGNGLSDPFQSSPYKQQIARAYGLSPQDTQNLINEQFDLLGEDAGLTRLGSTQAAVVLTFYTYQQPTSSITIPEGATVSTVPDSTTGTLTFTTQGQGTINIANLASFFNTNTGWWGVSVPAQCTQPGSIGNVGAGTIRQTVSGVPTGVNVTNLVGAAFGSDQESNSAFAARIQARKFTGNDSSSANGYLVTALSTPGVISAQVVAAGDLEMLRDWDPTRLKHVFGAVDIYARGTTFSQQDEFVPYSYANNGVYGNTLTYSTLAFIGSNTFQINNFSSLAFPPYDGVELFVSRASNAFYLSLDRAQFNNQTGQIIINPGDIAYQYVGSSTTKAKVPLTINNSPATNQAALAALSGAATGTYSFSLFMRLASPLSHVPALQPVLQVYSVTGSATGSGVLPNNDVTLVHTSDFLLNGGSNKAGDIVQVSLTSAPVQKTITVGSLTSPTLIDIGMNQPLGANGAPLNVNSVLSLDLSTSYVFGKDYNIVAFGPYFQYAIQPISSAATLSKLQIVNNVLTVFVANDFGAGASVTFSGIIDPTFASILNNQTVVIATVSPTQFTATFIQANTGPTTTSGIVTGSAIQAGQQVIVAYNKFVLYERLSFISEEAQVLSGTLPTTLDNDGFVFNTWLPESYTTGTDVFPVTQQGFALTLDGWNGLFGVDGGLDVIGSATFDPIGLVGNQIPHDSRYIKVTNGPTPTVVYKENLDFTLTVDSSSGSATLARILTGRIPDGGTVLVSYFVTETFTVSTQYPTFVELLANTIAQTQSAAADVLIKAMVANPVDITMTVTLNPNTNAATVDPVIRTAINVVLDNSSTTLFQSELVSQVQAVTGVQSVELPLIKCAKSDGSYDIGVVIPTGTAWTQTNKTNNAWVSTNTVLPDTTISTGGEPTAIVDVLYQGQVFRRATSLADFQNNSPAVPHLAVAPGIVNSTPGSFYIYGTDEADSGKIALTIPLDVPTPAQLSFFVTYQVFNEGGAKDVTVSPTEYLAPGTITINYVTAG